MQQFRIGHGFDLHRLKAGLPLVVAGQRLEHTHGCDAHSDGDVVYHALVDALMGALGKEDIGQLFPDNNPKWQGQDSALFVEKAIAIMNASHYEIGNIDITVVLQLPKLSPYKADMRTRIAALLNIDESQVNLKAKTHEHMDAIGEGKAIACHVVALVQAR